jgi:N-acetylglucosamine kinase-like BadF-type ATPase
MPEAALLAGFDAGQTHCRCRLADLEGRVLAEGVGSGVCHLAAPGGPERFQAALRSSLAAARAQPGAPSGPLAAAVVGASGIEADSPVQDLGHRLAVEALGLEPVLVTGDERTALAGAFAGGPGIVLISGTGCICVGRDADGRLHRCGGWGWLLDGAGSAMDIGRDGLALSLRMADGRCAESPLRQALWDALSVNRPQELKARVVDPGFGAAGFAALAPLVSASAAAGDPGAVAVLRRNGEALADLVTAVAAALRLDQPSLCCVGGAMDHLVPLRHSFERALADRLPGVVARPPLGDACSGALALAAGLLSR